MKGLLKLLTAFALTSTISTNVIACGNGNSDNGNEVAENSDVQELLQKAKEQINLGFGKLVDEYENLTFENQFGSLGADITSNLNSLASDHDTEITEKSIKDMFLNKLQEAINRSMVEDYLQVAELKPLFNNIPTNQILIIDINKTTLTKVAFTWDESTDFGVANYKPSDYQITMWHQLVADLKLKLTYKDESNNQKELEVANDFNFNYANKDAKLRNLVYAATAKIEETLKNFIVKVKTTINIDNYSNLKSIAKQVIEAQLSNPKIKIKTIETLSIDVLRKYDKYVSGDYMYEAITKASTDQAIAALEAYLTPVVTKFTTNLTNWIGTGPSAKLVTQQENINNFGTCTISNWTISGLTLKPINLDFVNIRADQTQQQWANETATALGTIFCTNGSFAQGRIDLATDGNLTIYMNPADFDEYVKEDKKISDVVDYLLLKINQKAKADGILKKSISFTLNGLTKQDPNLSNTRVIEKVDAKTFKIERKKGGMAGYNYLTIRYDNVTLLTGNVVNRHNNHILFNNWIIKKADSDIW